MKTDVFRNEWFADHWSWESDESPDVMLSQDRKAAYFYVDPVVGSTGTAGVRGNKAFCEGEHYWEVVFTEPPSGTSVMVGVGTKNAELHTENYEYINLLGKDAESWGLSYRGIICHNGQKQKYCEPFYEKDTVIGCHLDLNKGTLTFYKNGQSLGVAFKGLDEVGKPLYPMLSSTTVETELELGMRSCRHMSLQEKCCYTVTKTLRHVEEVNFLPLPNVIRQHIKQIL